MIKGLTNLGIPFPARAGGVGPVFRLRKSCSPDASDRRIRGRERNQAMPDLNKVFLMGRLTSDPELRRIPSGTAVTELRMATSRSWTGRDGERREETLFIDVTVWDRQAETCCQYLRKGSSIHVEGYLRVDTWDDKTTGEKRSKIRVQADRVQFLDSRRSNGGGESGAARATAPVPVPAGRLTRPPRIREAARRPSPRNATRKTSRSDIPRGARRRMPCLWRSTPHKRQPGSVLRHMCTAWRTNAPLGWNAQIRFNVVFPQQQVCGSRLRPAMFLARLHA